MRTSLFLILLACQTQTRVVPAVAPEPATPQAESAGVKVWANTALYVGAPNDIEGWVLPIGVDLENASANTVPFSLDDVRLRDDLGNETAPFFVPAFMLRPYASVEAMRERLKRSPLNAETVASAVTGRSTSVFVRDYWRGSPTGANAWFDITGLPTPPPRSWEPQVRFLGAPRDLALLSISDRAIEPGQRATGYLFFPRPQQGAKTLQMTWAPQGQPPVQIDFELKSSRS